MGVQDLMGDKEQLAAYLATCKHDGKHDISKRRIRVWTDAAEKRVPGRLGDDVLECVYVNIPLFGRR